MNLLRRLAIILFAFLVSTAAVVPVFLLLVIALSELPVLNSEILPYAFVGFVAVAVLAFVPATAVIAVAEWRRVRHWFFFVVAGGLTAVLSLIVLAFISGPNQGGPNMPGSIALFASGLAAGSVYWLIAGRTSGELRDAWVARGTAR